MTCIIGHGAQPLAHFLLLQNIGAGLKASVSRNVGLPNNSTNFWSFLEGTITYIKESLLNIQRFRKAYGLGNCVLGIKINNIEQNDKE